jgi:hypothetical protein
VGRRPRYGERRARSLRGAARGGKRPQRATTIAVAAPEILQSHAFRIRLWTRSHCRSLMALTAGAVVPQHVGGELRA